MKWIAFGDSNTRYWLGAYSWPGPIEEAWPARLEGLCRAQGADLTVVNEGYPGEEIAFARAQFDGLTQGADRVILAFGTNNIKMPESTLEAYLSYLKRILEQNGQRPMLVLSILWFGEGYGFPGAQERLPEWNGAIRELCGQYGALFLDTTEHFLEQFQLYNDKPVRHLNSEGQALLAQLIFQRLKEEKWI